MLNIDLTFMREAISPCQIHFDVVLGVDLQMSCEIDSGVTLMSLGAQRLQPRPCRLCFFTPLLLPGMIIAGGFHTYLHGCWDDSLVVPCLRRLV